MSGGLNGSQCPLDLKITLHENQTLISIWSHDLIEGLPLRTPNFALYNFHAPVYILVYIWLEAVFFALRTAGGRKGCVHWNWNGPDTAAHTIGQLCNAINYSGWSKLRLATLTSFTLTLIEGVCAYLTDYSIAPGNSSELPKWSLIPSMQPNHLQRPFQMALCWNSLQLLCCDFYHRSPL